MANTFGTELKRLAEEAGFGTQQELADASGVSQGMIAKLYQDQRPNVSAAVLFKLCAAIGVGCNHFAPYLNASDGGEPSLPSATRSPRKPKGK